MMSEKKRDNEDIAVHNLMRTEEGRQFVYDMLLSCGVFETIFDVDPIKHAYNAGIREMGLKLKRKVEGAEPDYYLVMMKENI